MKKIDSLESKVSINLDEIKLVGITVRSTNSLEANPETAKIGQIIGNYFENNLVSQIILGFFENNLAYSKEFENKCQISKTISFQSIIQFPYCNRDITQFSLRL